MSNLAWLFSVHDKDGDGFLTKDEVLQLSESLLVRWFLSIWVGPHRLTPTLGFPSFIVHLPKRAWRSLPRKCQQPHPKLVRVCRIDHGSPATNSQVTGKPTHANCLRRVRQSPSPFVLYFFTFFLPRAETNLNPPLQPTWD